MVNPPPKDIPVITSFEIPVEAWANIKSLVTLGLTDYHILL